MTILMLLPRGCTSAAMPRTIVMPTPYAWVPTRRSMNQG
jgi:hypothetical protein